MQKDDWQPIETAPRDGTEIVGWNDFYGLCWNASYSTLSEGWIVLGQLCHVDLTLWQPMPIPGGSVSHFPDHFMPSQ